MSEVNDFLNKLHSQTEPPKEKKDKAIMKVLGAWARKETDEYRSFTRNGGGPIEYLGDHSKRAGVDRGVAWEYVRSVIGKDQTDEFLEGIRKRFDTAYDAQEYEEWWRDKKFGFVK